MAIIKAGSYGVVKAGANHGFEGCVAWQSSEQIACGHQGQEACSYGLQLARLTIKVARPPSDQLAGIHPRRMHDVIWAACGSLRL